VRARAVLVRDALSVGRHRASRACRRDWERTVSNSTAFGERSGTNWHRKSSWRG